MSNESKLDQMKRAAALVEKYYEAGPQNDRNDRRYRIFLDRTSLDRDNFWDAFWDAFFDYFESGTASRLEAEELLKQLPENPTFGALRVALATDAKAAK
jgi:hypothetical protein